MAIVPLQDMAKNSPEGNRERVARHRKSLSERGIKQLQVMAPEAAHDLIRQAVRLMTSHDDPLEPRAALRRAGSANEPELGEASTELLAELETTRHRLTAVEREAEKQRAEIETQAKARERILQAERDAARAAEAESKSEAHGATRAAQEATERAEKAETAIRQAKALPGIKGRLVRWLAGDVLPD
jgi:chromosome segregation ATPase